MGNAGSQRTHCTCTARWASRLLHDPQDGHQDCWMTQDSRLDPIEALILQASVGLTQVFGTGCWTCGAAVLVLQHAAQFRVAPQQPIDQRQAAHGLAAVPGQRRAAQPLCERGKSTPVYCPARSRIVLSKPDITELSSLMSEMYTLMNMVWVLLYLST